MCGGILEVGRSDPHRYKWGVLLEFCITTMFKYLRNKKDRYQSNIPKYATKSNRSLLKRFGNHILEIRA